MTAEIHWLLPGRVIACRVGGALTVGELTTAAQTVVSGYLDAGTGERVHMLVDVSALRHTMTLIEARDAVYPLLSHPKLGWVVLYGLEHAFTRALIDTVLRALRKSYRIVSTRAVSIGDISY